MCFNQNMSLLFSGLGLAAMYYAYKRTHNRQLAMGIFYFFLMEFLQVLQYFVIDDCDSKINKFLTFLGIVHICYQPFFSNMLIFASIPKKREYDNWVNSLYTFRLAFVGGTFLLVRGLLGYYLPDTFIKDDISGMGVECFDKGYPVGCEGKGPISPEWIRGAEVCTYSGVYHLAWSWPMATPTYYLPSAFIHFFLMFVPFYTIAHPNLWVYGTFLLLTGPVLAGILSPNLQEQASIWCFFSVGQVIFMCVNAIFLDPNGDYYRGEARKKMMERKAAQKVGDLEKEEEVAVE